MSDDDDFDELPPISVNSSSSDSRSFTMPGAGEVAEARARAAHCEHQLLLLRAEHEAVTAPTAAAGLVAAQHSDSSGSEGEAALAAAVAALRVKRAALIAPDHAALLTPALASLGAGDGDGGAPWLHRYLQAARTTGAGAGRVRLALHTLEELSAAARAPDLWPREDALGAALWALTAAAAPHAPRRAHLARLSHRLVDDILSKDQVEVLVCALEAAVCTWSGARVEVVDVLRGGGSACRDLAHRLVAGGGGSGGVACDRYAALQLAGRALADLAARAPAPLDSRDVARRLDALAPKHPHPTPDELKVLVAASKIRVLFDIGR